MQYRYKSQTETYEELLTRAKLPTLYNRRLQDIAILSLMFKVKYGMAQDVYLSYSRSKVHTNALEIAILNYPALIQWPMGGIRYATKDLSFGQRSVVCRNLTSLKVFKKHLRGVTIRAM